MELINLRLDPRNELFTRQRAIQVAVFEQVIDKYPRLSVATERAPRLLNRLDHALSNFRPFARICFRVVLLLELFAEFFHHDIVEVPTS